MEDTYKETTSSNQYSELRAIIHQGLLDQLKEHEIDGPYFINLLNDYMAFWDIKNGLIRDIQQRGVMVEWRNSDTQFGHKKNDSIAELIRVNTQMMRILQQLNFKVQVPREEPEDDY
ncbi:ribonuclease H family protein [Sporosarcina cascadiensis]|uniref:RNA polymerase subunit sigma-70 n=1 Tax=Sporosarcina cascadiensis TaxID=2660747 RepID=UPI001E613048|nr:RNA polymerase subunit sigma-70 [Sporosarcina cascadiensis]